MSLFFIRARFSARESSILKILSPNAMENLTLNDIYSLNQAIQKIYALRGCLKRSAKKLPKPYAVSEKTSNWTEQWKQ
jgi:hypothetical protein